MKKIVMRLKGKIEKGQSVVRRVVSNPCGEGYIDTALKIIIGVVIGGVILAGLYTLFNTTILPTLTSKIGEMFSYTGA